MNARAIAALAGAIGLAMVLGAVFFQYVIGVAPCEVCYWQRYPHAAAAVVGLIAALCWGKGGDKWGKYAAGLTLGLIAAAGVLGVYHSGVEWRIFAGPTACTGNRIVYTASMDLNAAPVVRCDVVQWRLLGLFSLANLNAIFSLGVAALGAVLLRWPGLWDKAIGFMGRK